MASRQKHHHLICLHYSPTGEQLPRAGTDHWSTAIDYPCKLSLPSGNKRQYGGAWNFSPPHVLRASISSEKAFCTLRPTTNTPTAAGSLSSKRISRHPHRHYSCTTVRPSTLGLTGLLLKTHRDKPDATEAPPTANAQAESFGSEPCISSARVTPLAAITPPTPQETRSPASLLKGWRN